MHWSCNILFCFFLCTLRLIMPFVLSPREEKTPSKQMLEGKLSLHACVKYLNCGFLLGQKVWIRKESNSPTAHVSLPILVFGLSVFYKISFVYYSHTCQFLINVIIYLSIVCTIISLCLYCKLFIQLSINYVLLFPTLFFDFSF